MIRTVGDEGQVGAAETVAVVSDSRAGGFPRLTRLDDTLFFAWTVVGEPDRVQTAIVR